MRRVFLIAMLFVSGCAPTLVCDKHTILERAAEMEHKHGVAIEIKSFSNQSGLCGLLEVINKDLEACPQHFKENIGPIFIEKSFDELGVGGIPLTGYVNPADTLENYPIHIKNRSALEKILFPVLREYNVFLHEASHSFELNVRDVVSDKWDEFYRDFSGVQAGGYSEKVFSMPIIEGGVNHFEDFAETHCYLRRHNIEMIKDTEPVLYRKCKMVEKFTGACGAAEPSGLSG